jgi:hypothetical protein
MVTLTQWWTHSKNTLGINNIIFTIQNTSFFSFLSPSFLLKLKGIHCSQSFKGTHLVFTAQGTIDMLGFMLLCIICFSHVYFYLYLDKRCPYSFLLHILLKPEKVSHMCSNPIVANSSSYNFACPRASMPIARFILEVSTMDLQYVLSFGQYLIILPLTASLFWECIQWWHGGALFQVFFVWESINDLHTLKVELFVFLLTSVLHQCLQFGLTFLFMLAPTPTGWVVIEMMGNKSSCWLLELGIGKIPAQK